MQDDNDKKIAVMVMSKADAFAQAGKTAVLQNIHGTLQFLQRFPPINQMENAHLAFLVEQCQLRFYAPGESILKPSGGPVEHFYIVKQGRVVGEGCEGDDQGGGQGEKRRHDYLEARSA